MPVLGDIMDKIIFLDIDGVLNDNTINGYLNRCVDCFKKYISDEDIKIVIISSLQGTGTVKKRQKLENSLNEVGIKVDDFIDPNFKGNLGDVSLSNRVLGIIDYLKDHSDSEYVILDDEYKNDYKMLGLNHLEVDMWTGLEDKSLEKISFKKVNLNILNRVNYGYRELGEYELVTNNLVKTLKKVLEKQEDSKK